MKERCLLEIVNWLDRRAGGNVSPKLWVNSFATWEMAVFFFETIIFKLNIQNSSLGTRCEIVLMWILRWIPLPRSLKSTLVQVMAWHIFKKIAPIRTCDCLCIILCFRCVFFCGFFCNQMMWIEFADIDEVLSAIKFYRCINFHDERLAFSLYHPVFMVNNICWIHVPCMFSVGMSPCCMPVK